MAAPASPTQLPPKGLWGVQRRRKYAISCGKSPWRPAIRDLYRKADDLDQRAWTCMSSGRAGPNRSLGDEQFLDSLLGR